MNKLNINNAIEILFFVLIILTVISSFYSSILSFYFIIAIFAIFPNFFNNKILRVPFALLAILNACVMVSSRIYFVNIQSDDFIHYYNNFLDISNGGTIFVSQYGDGFEFLLPLYFYIISHFFGVSEVQYIFFSVCFLIAIIFYFWIEKFILKDFEYKYYSLILASFFIFFPYLSTTQIMRQLLASGLILIALGYGLRNYKGKVLYLLSIFAPPNPWKKV